jgi:hypothetical protein
MNDEYEEMIASFRIADDLEQAVEATIQTRLDEFAATPLNALPLGQMFDEHAAARVKRVQSRVIQRLKAA